MNKMAEIRAHTLSEFQIDPERMLRRLQKQGGLFVLTKDGKPMVVIQDAKAYRQLLDHIDRLEAIEGIKQGLKDMAQGKLRPAARALESIRKKHRIPSKP